METTTSARSFGALNLTAETLASLEAMGYRAPTDVQAETIPRALAGRDLVVLIRGRHRECMSWRPPADAAARASVPVLRCDC